MSYADKFTKLANRKLASPTAYSRLLFILPTIFFPQMGLTHENPAQGAALHKARLNMHISHAMAYAC